MIAGFAATAVLSGLIQAVAAADSPRASSAIDVPQTSAPKPAAPSAVPGGQRAQVLGKQWRQAADRAWTTSSDAQGFHILVAEKSSGYAWKTAASLSEPGFEADAWIGNACVTASGDRAVVVYAPRTFTNKPELMTRGAFTAVVDLNTGGVTKLSVHSSLAYFSPGCGRDERAVVSQFTDDSSSENATRLVAIDAEAKKAQASLKLDGQVTSAVPYQGGIAAADGYSVVKIDSKGKRTRLADTTGIAFQLRTDHDGGLVFLDRRSQGKAAVRRFVDSRSSTLATGRMADVDLTASSDGTVYITGQAKSSGRLPAAVKNPGVAKEAVATTSGQALVTSNWANAKTSPADADALSARPVAAEITTLSTGRTARLETTPGEVALSRGRIDQGRAASPALAPAEASPARTPSSAAAADPNNPVEDERTCAVPRNDVRKQALQPTPRQVEWAVDQAVTDNLDQWISRPANWNGTGVTAYSPQVLFPLRALEGDPNGVPDGNDDWYIPSQILLGITAQESNMWQATRYAVPGVTANPLIGNYYGIKYAADGDQGDAWAIDWTKADCGYGITQVTDGMRKSDTQLTTAQKEAAALDYTANIAYGADILASKWNETSKAGMTVNEGQPKYIESWFFALWAYNSGFHPQSEASSNSGKWGVGWTNNPANPLWKESRTPFLENASGADDYSHAAHPQDWPYQEKVIGWAARPISALFKPGDMQAGYRAAWWNSNAYRTSAKPPTILFCTEANDCDHTKVHDGSSNKTGEGPCKLPGDPDEKDPLYLKCWWHDSVKWKFCDAGQCGNPVHRFNSADYPEQPNENSSYPPVCDAGLPSGTLVVDDVANGTAPAGQSGHKCDVSRSAGTFSFTFASHNATYPGKIDLHQLGAAYGDHFWFSHTRKASDTDGARLLTTGTWSLGSGLNDWVRILVHLPDHGAHTQQAMYEIDTGSGTFTRTRYISQERKANEWVSLGSYKVSGKPRVRLANTTQDGTGDEDVAWDAVAFQPLGGKPKHVVAVLGDSYTSGEGAGDYLPETNKDHGTKQWNACRRSKNAWARKMVLPGMSQPVGTSVDHFSSDVELGFAACSGAMTKNVAYVPSGNSPQKFGEGQFNEVLQVDSGVLSNDTTLVMLTLGGNDEGGFANAMSQCILPTDCATDSFLPEKKAIIDRMIPDLTSVLESIATKAPNAQIVLMGYPELLSRTVKCTGSLWLDMTEVEALATLVNYADAEQKKAVDTLRTGSQKLKVEYANPVDAFVGHGGCDDPEWINKVVTGPNGDGDFHDGDPAAQPGVCLWGVGDGVCISRESFHPKGAGTTGYADVMRKRLGEIGYTGS
ncbi:GDSL-type esterase/lipase family protein [Streptomyces sp. ITFR-16]|uniref:SGNH/GDSL hydrolase family protein n=1 Tax=Streptomyces sp. ITFR-16 TaxID=3075198 RepID=UPI0028897508|nr:GDSL-type esterase/lipase family protein [Streptomyces sp. ITFR-16]WNI22736.1 GDSL-type esterase/lipase family protein [Streptomyces sp. ITFR-16]